MREMIRAFVICVIIVTFYVQHISLATAQYERDSWQWAAESIELDYLAQRDQAILYQNYYNEAEQKFLLAQDYFYQCADLAAEYEAAWPSWCI